MVNRMRATRAHRDNRRSHHALTGVRLSKCSNCGGVHQSHTVCVTCGYYNGRQVIDVKAAITKKAKKTKEAETAR
ncbi:MAG: 50S ribosomal protein L32 [bacterium]